MRTKDQILLEAAYDNVNKPTNALEFVKNKLTNFDPNEYAAPAYHQEVKERAKSNLENITKLETDPEFVSGMQKAHDSNPQNFQKFIGNVFTNRVNDRFIEAMKKGIIPNPMWVWG